MEYCRFHPVDAATWYCSRCTFNVCDSCIDDGGMHKDESCFSCGGSITSLGAKNNAKPFWRRLEESFKYPLTKECMFLIGVVSFLSTLLSSIAQYVPFAIFPIYLLYGLMLKYCFSCLTLTARGKLTAPDITAAYGGGGMLLLKFFVIMVAAGLSVYIAQSFIGMGFGMLLGCFWVIGFPAIIINYSITEEIGSAMNPFSILKVVLSIGMPYVLILCFILVMTGSVSVINELLGGYSWLSEAFQSVTSNYYSVVIFHLIGYMVFQYQDQFGFVAREDEGPRKKIRPESEKALAKIEVFLKEGEYQRVIELYQLAIKKQPKERILLERFFKYLIATKDTKHLPDFADSYLRQAVDKGDDYNLSIYFQQIQTVLPKYLPSSPELRLSLAKNLYSRGDFKRVIKVLNKLHKLFPEFKGTAEAYALLAQSLERVPGMAESAKKYWFAAKKMGYVGEVIDSAAKASFDSRPLSAQLATKASLGKPSLKEGLVVEEGRSQGENIIADKIAKIAADKAAEKDRDEANKKPIEFEL